jgi:hypothetical protein
MSGMSSWYFSAIPNFNYISAPVGSHTEHIPPHLYMCSLWDSAKIFFTSKFSYLLLSNLTPKAKLGLQQVGPTNSNPPGPIKVYSQAMCSAFYKPQQHTVHNATPIFFCKAKPAYFDFSSWNFLSWPHTYWVLVEMLLVNLFEISVSCKGAFSFLKLF